MEQGHPPATMAFTDRRWTIMAALLGSNTAVMLVHGLQQEMNPSVTREFALTLIAVTLPFQAVYFMIHTYADSFAQNLAPAERRTLERLSTVCQIIAYASLLGLAILWSNVSPFVGCGFLVASFCALLMVRLAMREARSSSEAARSS